MHTAQVSVPLLLDMPIGIEDAENILGLGIVAIIYNLTI
jgi:hypothetical protein